MMPLKKLSLHPKISILENRMVAEVYDAEDTFPKKLLNEELTRHTASNLSFSASFSQKFFIKGIEEAAPNRWLCILIRRNQEFSVPEFSNISRQNNGLPICLWSDEDPTLGSTAVELDKSEPLLFVVALDNENSSNELVVEGAKAWLLVLWAESLHSQHNQE